MKTELVLKAISRSAASLFRDKDFGGAVRGLLRRVGRAAGASRVYYFQNHPGPHGEPAMTQLYEWVAPGISPQIDNPEMTNLPWSRLPGVRERLRSGPVYGLARNMSASFRDILERQQILSLALVPVHVNRKWEGFIGFDDCADARRWRVEEIETLRAAAGILGGAIDQHRSRDQLQSILENAIDRLDTGIIILDRDFRIAWINRAMEESFGISRRTLLRRNYRAFVRDVLAKSMANGAEFARRLTRAYKAGRALMSFRCETAPAPGGGERFFLYTSTPLIRGALAGGRIEHCADITAVERARLALGLSEKKYRDLVERMNEGIVYADSSGVIRYVNRGFCRMLGFRIDQIIGRSALTLIGEGGRRLYRSEFRNRRRGKSGRYELELRDAAGEGVPVLISSVSVFNERGRFNGSYSVVTDMRERRRLEVVKDDIIRDASHELKAPTAKIRMGLDLIKKHIKKPLGEEGELGIRMIDTEVSRIQHNINSLIDLAAFDAKTVTLRREKIDLPLLISGVAAEFRDIAAKKGLTIDIPEGQGGMLLAGNRDQVTCLFRHLLDNAVKFSRSGAITVLARPFERHAVVDIIDSGRGIEPAYAEMIFERRFQRYPSDPGTGLGLTICRKIAELHKGRIWAESAGRGLGMTVHIELPLARHPRRRRGSLLGKIRKP